MSLNRNQALRAGGACVRCRKGKTKCFYETGDPPCRNCEKGGHVCYLPSDREPPMAAPARVPASRPPPPVPIDRMPVPTAGRHIPTSIDKLGPELFAECERVVSKTFPASIAFHKPSFIQQLKAGTLEPVLVYGLLTVAARSSPSLIRRHSGATTQGMAQSVADMFSLKALAIINDNLDTPSLPDIQSLCLLIIHEWGNRNAVRAYTYLGQAARMLQMHHILGPPPPRNESDRFHHDESLRRTVWLIYILDCMLTSTPGRRPALDQADYEGMSLPCQDVYFVFGNTSYAPTLDNTAPKDMPAGASLGEVGELGFIVIGTTIWRDVVHFLTGLREAPFAEADCNRFLARVDDLRKALPMQYVDKPQQINLHITMGSGFTFAMVHSLIHCTSIFLQRRRMLDHVIPPASSRDAEGNFVPPSTEAVNKWYEGFEAWRDSAQGHETIHSLLNSCHTVISLLNALDAQGDKDSNVQFPIYMLFAAFSASATIAYLSLKGLTPRHSIETANTIVSDGLRFMSQAVDMWTLTGAWHRHLGVMERILAQEGAKAYHPAAATYASSSHPLSVKDDVVSNADSASHPDAMDYDTTARPSSASARAHSEGVRDGSEPPTPLPRRPGVTTINGGAATGVSTPATAAAGSPGAAMHDQSSAEGSTTRVPLPSSGSGTAVAPPAIAVAPPAPAAQSPPPGPQDMNAAELCAAFEKQLLELDDLAAFMGGGV